MFAGFQLKLDEKNFEELNNLNFIYYKEKGKEILESKKSKIEENIDSFFKYGKIDATQMAENWFPEIKVDIFLSHSHADEDLALALVGWLKEEFGLLCFVDSVVWGYSNELLQKINDKYSDKVEEIGRNIYNLEKCNRAASNVYMILNVALQKMIDKTEAVFLLNTENSITNDITCSSWIYSEIFTSEIIRKKPLSEYRDEGINMNILNESYIFNMMDFPKFEYCVSTKHLLNINHDSLKEWILKYKERENLIEYPLDLLYEGKISNSIYGRYLNSENLSSKLNEVCKIVKSYNWKIKDVRNGSRLYIIDIEIGIDNEGYVCEENYYEEYNRVLELEKILIERIGSKNISIIRENGRVIIRRYFNLNKEE